MRGSTEVMVLPSVPSRGAMIDDNAKPGSRAGGEENHHIVDFVVCRCERDCTPHVSQNDTNCCSAIDARMTRHPRPSHQHDQAQTDPGMLRLHQGDRWLRKTRHRGRALVEWFFVLTASA